MNGNDNHSSSKVCPSRDKCHFHEMGDGLYNTRALIHKKINVSQHSQNTKGVKHDRPNN